MKRIVISGLLVISFAMQLKSQSFPLGARAAGLGNTAVTLQDSWCAFQNIGGLGSVKKTSVLMGYENRFGMNDGLQTIGAGIVLPSSVGVGSISVSRFGDNIFSVHILSMGYSHQIDHFNLGIRLNQHQYSMESFGTKTFATIDIGGVATIIPELVWGLQIKNINHATISRFTGEKAASLIQTGLSYRPEKTLMINLEIEQEVNEDPVIKAGTEYIWQEKLAFRTGINSQFQQHYFGIGLVHRMLNIDYALSTHASLGFSHQLSIAYHLEKKKK